MIILFTYLTLALGKIRLVAEWGASQDDIDVKLLLSFLHNKRWDRGEAMLAPVPPAVLNNIWRKKGDDIII